MSTEIIAVLEFLSRRCSDNISENKSREMIEQVAFSNDPGMDGRNYKLQHRMLAQVQ